MNTWQKPPDPAHPWGGRFPTRLLRFVSGGQAELPCVPAQGYSGPAAGVQEEVVQVEVHGRRVAALAPGGAGSARRPAATPRASTFRMPKRRQAVNSPQIAAKLRWPVAGIAERGAQCPCSQLKARSRPEACARRAAARNRGSPKHTEVPPILVDSNVDMGYLDAEGNRGAIAIGSPTSLCRRTDSLPGTKELATRSHQ